jgi:polysaccharide pyruvyl transferase WcaK-like protein
MNSNSAGEQTLVVAGSFGFGNVGDEAVPLALADLAAARMPGLAIETLTRYSRVTLPGIVTLGADDHGARQALSTKPIVYVGGGVVEDRDHCVLLRCSRFHRQLRPIRWGLFASSVEAGVRFGWRRKRRLQRVLRQAELLLVRDVYSRDALCRLVGPRNEIAVTGDSVLWMSAGAYPAEWKLPPRYIAITLRSSWSEEKAARRWLAEGLVALARRLDAALVFVPCSTAHDYDDRVEHRAVAGVISAGGGDVEILHLESVTDPRVYAAVLRDASLTISMRLHGCVISYAQETPFVGIAYHPKLAGFAATVGWERFVLPSALPPRQGSGTYGYAFSDISLSSCSLADSGVGAIEYSDFTRLEGFRDTLAQSLTDFLER